MLKPVSEILKYIKKKKTNTKNKNMNLESCSVSQVPTKMSTKAFTALFGEDFFDPDEYIGKFGFQAWSDYTLLFSPVTYKNQLNMPSSFRKNEPHLRS